MTSFRCYDNSDVIATLIITNFHLYLIQLWWQFFQMFVYGDVVVLLKLRSYWPRKAVSYHFICQYDLCCCIVWPSFLFDCFVFGQMVYPQLPPPHTPPSPCKKLRVRLSSHEKPIRKWKTPGGTFTFGLLIGASSWQFLKSGALTILCYASCANFKKRLLSKTGLLSRDS